ncbi:MAG: YqaJ viral recombinase family protein [Planctomycetes bacterium]|nr:YqaJ viral recombinase family protein [Planctomycetota bacterium]
MISRAEWLRRKREPITTLGSSSAAAACGLDPYTSALALYHAMRATDPVEDADPQNDHLYFGNVLEPIVVSEACKRLGLRWLDPNDDAWVIEAEIERDGRSKVEAWVLDFGRLQPLVSSVEKPWRVSTLDACAVDRDGRFVIVEAKNQGERRNVFWDADGACPDSYRIQCLHQALTVPSAARVVLAAIVGGNRFRSVDIDLAPETLADLDLIESQFMRNLAAGIEPDADGSVSATRTLRSLHPDDNGLTATLPSASCALHAEIVELEDQAKPLRKALADLEYQIGRRTAWLEQRIGSNTFGLIPNGAGKYSLKTQRTANGGTTRVLRFIAAGRK